MSSRSELVEWIETISIDVVMQSPSHLRRTSLRRFHSPAVTSPPGKGDSRQAGGEDISATHIRNTAIPPTFAGGFTHRTKSPTPKCGALCSRYLF